MTCGLQWRYPDQQQSAPQVGSGLNQTEAQDTKAMILRRACDAAEDETRGPNGAEPESGTCGSKARANSRSVWSWSGTAKDVGSLGGKQRRESISEASTRNLETSGRDLCIAEEATMQKRRERRRRARSWKVTVLPDSTPSFHVM